MQVTEKWLGDIGGWQAMKVARELVRTGSVSEVTTEGRTCRGLVGSGPRKYRASLTAGDGLRADGKCACPDAQRGLICAHMLAVALSTLHPPAPAAARPSPALSRTVSGGVGAAPPDKPKPVIRDEDIPAGQFTVFLPPDLLDPKPGRGAAATHPVLLQFQAGGTEKEPGIARWLLEHGMPVRTSPLRLPCEDLGSLLAALVNHPRVLVGTPSVISTYESIKKQINIFISNQLKVVCTTKFDNVKKVTDFQLFEDGSQRLNRVFGSWFVRRDGPSLVSLPTGLPPDVLDFVQRLLETGAESVPITWLAGRWAQVRELVQPGAEDDPLHRFRVLPAQPPHRLQLDGDLRRLEARLEPLLPGGDVARPTDYPSSDAEDPMLFYTWNPDASAAAGRALEAAGLQPAAQGGHDLKGERDILRFLASELPRLRRVFEVVEGEGWRRATRGLAVIRPSLRPPADSTAPTAAGVDWLSLQVAYTASDGFSIPRHEVLRLIRSGQRHLRGRDGSRYLLDTEGCGDLEEVIQDVESRLEGGDRLTIRPHQAEVLGDFLERPQAIAPLVSQPLDLEELRRRLGALAKLVRPYQLEGIRWLERHARSRGGALLADEMGLGKTLQTLALLRVVLARAKESVQPHRPALIVCPTSLLRNWADEAARFTPELRTQILHDSRRHQDLGNWNDFDVIITSYALISRDLPHYIKTEFTACVLDEASFIRNPDTVTAKAVRQLRAGSRIALTGTPVENSPHDLWSIFEFLAPRQLPPRTDFEERFVKPLSQGDSNAARHAVARLRRLIRPQVLRRTKQEVAKDLPEKIEKVLWCDLSGPQREVYQRLLDEGREEIRQARRRVGQGGARMTMFTVLLRLRQVCNDLRLLQVQGSASASSAENSGKWAVFDELLQETLDGGHKALIFSQFVQMLRLIRQRVETDGTPCCYLDGSSQDRSEQVVAFQSDPTKRLFLISLKAGGYGLNLTAADEVVLVDPWWNPAVEAQAIDRAHRIGQGRPVTVYRLITRGTVEERMIELQSRKRAIQQQSLEDDTLALDGLEEDELERILGC